MWLTQAELRAIGFKDLGRNVLVDSAATVLGAENVVLGSKVRIDAGAVLSAGPQGIRIGSYVHIAASARVFAPVVPVILSDFVGLSSGVAVYSSSDDFTSGALTGPTVPIGLRNVISAPVFLDRHVVVGANSVVMPGVSIGLGGAVGALTFVSRNVLEGEVVVGAPMRVVGRRPISILLQNEARLTKSDTALIRE